MQLLKALHKNTWQPANKNQYWLFGLVVHDNASLIFTTRLTVLQCQHNFGYICAQGPDTNIKVIMIYLVTTLAAKFAHNLDKGRMKEHIYQRKFQKRKGQRTPRRLPLGE